MSLMSLDEIEHPNNLSPLFSVLYCSLYEVKSNKLVYLGRYELQDFKNPSTRMCKNKPFELNLT